MRFVFSRALNYLIPRWRQLSVSIISLISVLVISLVVWLVLVFLSVTEGIEKRWIQQLISLHAPVRVTPTEAYYNSYYYQIDTLSSQSNYTAKTIGEKLQVSIQDPYDATIDAELPSGFPAPIKDENGALVDLAKEAWEAISSVKGISDLRVREYETNFGQLRLSMIRQNPTLNDQSQTFITQVSYISSFDNENSQFSSLLLTPTLDDFNNLLFSLESPAETSDHVDASLQSPLELATETTWKSLFNNLEITAIQSDDKGSRFPRALFPQEGSFQGCGIVQNGRITKIFIPQNTKDIAPFVKYCEDNGYPIICGEIHFGQGRPSFIPVESSKEIEVPKRLELFLAPGIQLQTKLVQDSLFQAQSARAVQFQAETVIQGTPLSGVVRMGHFKISEVKQSNLPAHDSSTVPFWVSTNEEGKLSIPTNTLLGEGIIVAKSYRDNGVRLGDKGHISYFTQTASGMQEQRLPIYVAGFYDPGFLPLGSKVIYIEPEILAEFRGNANIADVSIGNGLSLFFGDMHAASSIKKQLVAALEERGLSSFWKVETFEDYEFSRPILDQLRSDKTLFSLIALIILLVACSNVISMLILLVNDKKREIGILRALGASALRIGAIFGVCGFFTGLVSSLIGFSAALFTLNHLQSLVNFLSFVQGREAFHSAFFGETLPNELSLTALIFVLFTTSFLALLAGIAPAFKAARIRPSEILRSD